MDKADIRRVINEVTGDPETGAIAEIVPSIVDALDAALNPVAPKAKETRVIEAAETR